MTDAIGPKSSYDFAGLGELKARAASDRSDDAAIKKAAQQFEAMFLQMMMKSMRATVEKGGLFDSQASETFEQMYDQQIVMDSKSGHKTTVILLVKRCRQKPAAPAGYMWVQHEAFENACYKEFAGVDTDKKPCEPPPKNVEFNPFAPNPTGHR